MTMTITTEWMRQKYNYFNKILFEELLPKEGDIDKEYTVEFLPIKKDVRYLGQCRYRQNNHYIVVLNNKYEWLTEIEWQNVLAHEMIHVWQGIMGFKDSHGKSFKMKAKEINSFNIGDLSFDITTKYDNFREK